MRPTQMRQVTLPDTIAGHLYLHHTPGRPDSEPLDVFLIDVAKREIDRVVCLVAREDIRRDSPDYHHILAGDVPWEHVDHPIPDFGIPANPEAFRALAKATAEALQDGKKVLIHCGAGIGRTGTCAIAVLLALGMSLPDATQAVEAVHSRPETKEQRDLLARIAGSPNKQQ
jgi:protein-tyrosine phosphatase